MEKSDKKRILTKILIVIAALTLLSCCFLGSTFARYTASGSGAASIGVAEWDVTVTPSAEFDVEQDANKLSPSKTAYTDAETTRSNSTEKFLVATITNSGDVNALVSVTGADDVTLTATGYGDNNRTTAAEACFSIKLYKGDDANDTDTTTALGATENVVAENGTLYIFAQITWTTQDSGSDGTAGDSLDTWIGQYATKVSWTLSYSAVQDSQIPDKTQP